MTKQQIREELKQAMLAKDSNKTSVLRMVISSIGYYEIQKGGAGYEATDEDVETVIQKEAKQHRDSMEQFQTAGRVELEEEDIRKLVQETILTTGAKSTSDMGHVMGVLAPKTKGCADGKLVSQIVM